MPHYFFDLFNDQTVVDEEGQDQIDETAAMETARYYARDMASEAVRAGRLCLSHRIVVRNETEVVCTVHFRDVVTVEA